MSRLPRQSKEKLYKSPFSQGLRTLIERGSRILFCIHSGNRDFSDTVCASVIVHHETLKLSEPGVGFTFLIIYPSISLLCSLN